MNVRGWIYVITNDSIGDVVKVGFSTKDPELRAAELNHTGVPLPYRVAFSALVVNPRDVEQSVHRYLVEKRKGKEWFRCGVSEAVTAIKQVLGESGILYSQHTELLSSSPGTNPPSIEIGVDEKLNEFRPMQRTKSHEVPPRRTHVKPVFLCWNCGTLVGDDPSAICRRCGKKHPLSSLAKR